MSPGAAATASSAIFAPAPTLPKGPHSLTREQVAASQRERLLAAITHLVAEGGYASATITQTARRAGVSPNVFYEHFANKQECFLAAYDFFAVALLGRVAAGLQIGADWGGFIGSAAHAYLEALESDRIATRAFLLEMDAAGPETRQHRTAAIAGFAALIAERHRQMRIQDPSLGELPERIYLGLSLGVRALVCGALEEEPSPTLTDLVPDVVLWATATIYGAAAAHAA
jgi:AcrR family transcriptional regulator